MNRILFTCFVTLFGTTIVAPANAGIVLDFTQDNGFFTANPVARDSLNRAVSDINALLNFNLGAVVNDVTVGSSGGGTSVSFDWNYVYTHPSTGASVNVPNTAIPANEIRIFAGMRNLTGTTLGQGGPGGGGFSIGATVGSGSVSTAIQNAQAIDQHGRGSGPTISTLAGSINTSQGNSPYSFGLGATVGNLWFDSDTNNDGATDDAATLNANWHFDSTTAVAAGKSDFYSVALHETLHSIGFGTSDTWNLLVAGGNWLGANAIALNGTGTGLIDTGSGAHIANGILSTRLSDGVLQETVMSPSITIGTRKTFTALDAAFLRDLNFNTTAVPEPSSLLFVAIIAGVFKARSRRKKRSLDSATCLAA